MFTLMCMRCLCCKHCGWTTTTWTWKDKEKLITRGDIRRSSTLLSENGEFYDLPPPVWLVIGRAAVHHILGSFPAVRHYWHAPIITPFLPTLLAYMLEMFVSSAFGSTGGWSLCESEMRVLLQQTRLLVSRVLTAVLFFHWDYTWVSKANKGLPQPGDHVAM